MDSQEDSSSKSNAVETQPAEQGVPTVLPAPEKSSIKQKILNTLKILLVSFQYALCSWHRDDGTKIIAVAEATSSARTEPLVLRQIGRAHV